MKKLFGVLLLLMLSVALAACGGSAETEDIAPPQWQALIDTQEQTVDEEEIIEEETIEEDDAQPSAEAENASSLPVPTESVILPLENILRDFNAITQDMTIDDISRLVGSAATLEFESDLIRIYYWEYAEQFYIDVTLDIWDDEEIVSAKKISIGNDLSIFMDGVTDLSQALDLHARMEDREQVSYEEFVASFGSPGFLIDVDWGFTNPSYHFNWRSESRSVAASFVNGYAISISVTTF